MITSYDVLGLHRKGLRLVPLRGKIALLRDWPELHLGTDDIRSWAAQGVNWGIVTGDPLIVLDTDTEDAEAWVKAHSIDSSVVVRTGRGGFHRYFRSPDDTEIHSTSAAHGIPGLDVKGWRSYIVAAGSIHPNTGRRYEYLPGKEIGELLGLPLFDPTWIHEERRSPLPPSGPVSQVSGKIRNIRSYIRRIPSVQGQGGDRACFIVACLLAQAGLSFDEIVSELDAWNEVCAVPLWSRKELERKARYAFGRIQGK